MSTSGGFQAHDVTPDVLTFTKGLDNGLGLARVVAPASLMDGVRANSISTFGGNPLATAGGLANPVVPAGARCAGAGAQDGQQLRGRIVDALDGVPGVADIRGKGLMLGIEFAADDHTPDQALATAALERCRAGGLLVGKGGLYGNVLRIAPPLMVTSEESTRARGC